MRQCLTAYGVGGESVRSCGVEPHPTSRVDRVPQCTLHTEAARETLEGEKAVSRATR